MHDFMIIYAIFGKDIFTLNYIAVLLMPYAFGFDLNAKVYI